MILTNDDVAASGTTYDNEISGNTDDTVITDEVGEVTVNEDMLESSLYEEGSIEYKLNAIGYNFLELSRDQYALKDIKGKGDYKKVATRIRANVLDLGRDVKEIRARMLENKKEVLGTLTGIRKTRSKESLEAELDIIKKRLAKM
jgi:hypothetical protein